MSRGLASAIAVLIVSQLAACAAPRSSGEGRWLGIEGRDQETLAAGYPPGTPRSEVWARKREALVFSIHRCDFGLRDRDRFLDRALEEFKNLYPDETPSCDVVRLARTGWSSVIGAVGLYQDYVFYDARDRVLVAFRAFLHRSGR